MLSLKTVIDWRTRSRFEGDRRTELRRAASMLRRCVGRSDRSAQGDRPTLRSFRPKRATFWSFHSLMESMEGPRKQPPNCRAFPFDRRTG